MIAEADFVIAGGGTAGCVLANRLSSDARNSVALVEAGSEDTSLWIRVPAGAAKLFPHPTLNWRYWTEPEPALRGRKLYWPRGKVLGGTSSINGMTYVRGNRADYDEWSRIAGDAWSWDRVLPYYRKLEDSPIGDPALRGKGGPLGVGLVESPHPLSRAYLEAAVAAGIPGNDDYNGATQDGLAFNQVTMRGGVRVSAASAYLAPVRSRANLRVLTESTVHRVIVERGRAAGIELTRGGRVERIRARREVILCAGAVASPQVLMLSGIGDSAALVALGIPVVAHRPQVGRNLQEHVRAQVVYRTRVPSYNRDATGWRLLREVARYALGKRGLLAVTASQVNGFVRSTDGLARPDVQLVFRPSSGDYRDGRYVVHAYQGVMAMAGLLHPRSRGHVALASRDPRAAPAIVAGHLADPADMLPLMFGVRLLRRIFATPPIAAMIDAEVRPGADVGDDASLREYLQATADSLYHAVGTCAMGLGDDAVTTPDLRVRGVDGLRVVDASVMPATPTGNTAAPVLMIAERAADWILQS